MPTYPVFPDGLELRLRAVELAAQGDPAYLDHPECSYPDAIKRMLRGFLGAGPVPEASSRVKLFPVKAEQEGSEDIILSEIEATIEEMKSLESAMSGATADTGDRIAIIKAKTALLERWTILKERVFNLKEMSQFQAVVLGAMDQILDVDQRADFRARLAGLRSVSARSLPETAKNTTDEAI